LIDSVFYCRPEIEKLLDCGQFDIANVLGIFGLNTKNGDLGFRRKLNRIEHNGNKEVVVSIGTTLNSYTKNEGDI